MNLPNSIPHSVDCPSCDNDLAKLQWQKDTSGYDYLVYNCSFCKEGWTTNESDEISVKTRQNKKRNDKIKDKIKNHYKS